jgi:solute carrier family 9 (sodium/hydrogen exchanger), member 6/7
MNINGNNNNFNVASFFSSLGNFLKIFSGAFIIGSTIGCLTALITKFTSLRDHPLLETALFILMSYSTYLASEAAQFTGIVAVLFCGIFQAHYTFNNLSDESKLQTKNIFNLFNFLLENFIFIYIGITMFTFHSHKWEFIFIIGSFVSY